MNRRRFLRYSAGVAAAGAAGVVGYTFGVEPHWVEVVQRPLPVTALPPSLVGRRLIQISDWHVGPRVDDQYLVRCLKTVADLKPDILAITGDLITYRGPEQLSQLRQILTHLPKPRLASLAVLGKAPFLPPPILPVENRHYVSDEVPLADGRRLYINRGLGHLLEVRFNARPEITVFTLATAIP